MLYVSVVVVVSVGVRCVNVRVCELVCGRGVDLCVYVYIPVHVFVCVQHVCCVYR